MCDREVECLHCVLEVHFPAEGNALGDIAGQGGLNADGLCNHEMLTYVKKLMMGQCV